jgi:hypothetical protein
MDGIGGGSQAKVWGRRERRDWGRRRDKIWGRLGGGAVRFSLGQVAFIPQAVKIRRSRFTNRQKMMVQKC